MTKALSLVIAASGCGVSELHYISAPSARKHTKTTALLQASIVCGNIYFYWIYYIILKRNTTPTNREYPVLHFSPISVDVLTP